MTLQQMWFKWFKRTSYFYGAIEDIEDYEEQEQAEYCYQLSRDAFEAGFKAGAKLTNTNNQED